jgi:FAD/FMN-containing dehydrogenase
MSRRTMSYVYRPSTREGVADVLALARRTGRTVAMMGGGRSYGDAFQNEEGIVLDIGRMNRILAWDPATGVIKAEPGLRLADLWRYAIEDGYWPPVVSGTMFTTLGGCCGMNIHGKNAWKVGTFGDHVSEFELMLPSGEIRTVTRASDPDLFRGAISGFGVLGVFLSITLKLKRIHSGLIEVTPQRVGNFDEMIAAFEENATRMDYMVGWADCFPTAPASVGRGEMHFARHLEPGEDPAPAQTLRVCNQELPENLAGFVPKSIMWRLLKPFINDLGMRTINTVKYFAQYRPGAAKPYHQSHAAFHFLLDYVPNWKESYRPGGLIQYQSFVPREKAARVFAEQIRMAGRRGLPPYLGVTKKHRPDDFLISHGVDGYSLALDFRVTESNRKALWRLCHEMDELVLDAGGRFYLAKDSTMRRGTAARYLPPENIATFAQLRQRCDPDGILASDLMRRVFGSTIPQRTGGASSRTTAASA